MPDQLSATLATALARAPDWVRRELTSSEPEVRSRAEKTLAAMLAAAIRPALEATGE